MRINGKQIGYFVLGLILIVLVAGALSGRAQGMFSQAQGYGAQGRGYSESGPTVGQAVEEIIDATFGGVFTDDSRIKRDRNGNICQLGSGCYGNEVKLKNRYYRD